MRLTRLFTVIIIGWAGLSLPAYVFAQNTSAGGERELKLPAAIKINRANQKHFSQPIKKIAKKYRLEPALLHAVISVESGYNPQALSSAGAIGMMQLMPATAAELGVSDPYDPIANISGGARYLRQLLNKFGRINIALAAYHAGEGRVSRGRRTIPNILTTRKYVVSVLHHYMRYKKAGF